MSGRRVWLAFESAPGATIGSLRDATGCWVALADACRGRDGKIDVAEFGRWVNCLVEHSHSWGSA
jgi:hypothetical protein